MQMWVGCWLVGDVITLYFQLIYLIELIKNEVDEKDEVDEVRRSFTGALANLQI